MNDKLLSLINETFETKIKSINDDFNIREIEEWDSFNHINLMVALETEFDIEIEPSQVEKLHTIGDIKLLLSSK